MPKSPEVFLTLIEELGGEPLNGSGFEDEVPETMVSRSDGELATGSPRAINCERGRR